MRDRCRRAPDEDETYGAHSSGTYSNLLAMAGGAAKQRRTRSDLGTCRTARCRGLIREPCLAGVDRILRIALRPGDRERAGPADVLPRSRVDDQRGVDALRVDRELCQAGHLDADLDDRGAILRDREHAKPQSI